MILFTTEMMTKKSSEEQKEYIHFLSNTYLRNYIFLNYLCSIYGPHGLFYREMSIIWGEFLEKKSSIQKLQKFCYY